MIAIAKQQQRLDLMDQWNQKQHAKSGLIPRVLASEHDCQRAEEETLAFLQQYVAAGKSPMCGNSICQDRRFMAREMPQLEAFFHYRNLDVSSVKELASRWYPEVAKGFSKEP